MTSLYARISPRKRTTAVERLSDHVQMPTLPWPATRLVRRHGLHASTAKTVAELIGYTLEAR